MTGFLASCALLGNIYRHGKLSFHDTIDALAVRAEIAGVPFEVAAPLIAQALRDSPANH